MPVDAASNHDAGIHRPPDLAMLEQPEPAVRTSHHSVRLLPTMDQALRAIFDAMSAARRSLDVETYILTDDRLGGMLAAELARVAARGVAVRLLYDPQGSQNTEGSFFERLASAGVRVRAYRPLRVVVGRGRLFPRDHSRIVRVDDTVAFTGGAAWDDRWLPKRLGGAGWHDVCCEIRGPIVADFARSFEARYREADGDPSTPRDLATGDKYPDVELVSDTPDHWCLVYEKYRKAVQGARRRVYIENAYFFPPKGLEADLLAAAARGVDVRVILPSDSDLPIIARAARTRYDRWTQAGVRVFEYESMTHSKFALADDDWATVGTFNANATSLEFVNELNLMIRDAAFVRRVHDQFLLDLTRSREVGDGWPRVPPHTRLVNRAAAGALLAFEALSHRMAAMQSRRHSTGARSATTGK